MSIWASGAPYDRYVGRWSRPVARTFVEWLGQADGGAWLDVGCGTGALSATILREAAPAEVVGIDASQGFVEYVRTQVQDRRASFEVADAQALPFDAGRFDCAVSGLVLNFIPQPERALAEMARTVRSDGTVALYLWDYAEGMQMMRHFWDAAAALDPNAVPLDEGRRFPICQPEPLAQLFRDAGLAQVEVRAIDEPTVFRDFEDYWSPFLGAQGPAPSYVTSLTETARAALRERLRATLPTAADGAIRLTTRAWAARGLRT
ncbi:MAG: methyltransferase domain-containing protein [Chloroflexi bacterium]|nr:methyltransferase domain-containing protein [Chloroflexota bacterium]